VTNGVAPQSIKDYPKIFNVMSEMCSYLGTNFFLLVVMLFIKLKDLSAAAKCTTAGFITFLACLIGHSMGSLGVQ
jgi:hypothetical protein